MRRGLAAVGTGWLVLTALGEALAALADFYPEARSDKGADIEQAFRLLVYFAVLVLALVVAVLVYSVLRQRTVGPPAEDGPPLRGRGLVPWTWFAATTALTVTIMTYPGLVGLPHIQGHDEEPGDLGSMSSGSSGRGCSPIRSMGLLRRANWSCQSIALFTSTSPAGMCSTRFGSRAS